AVRYDVMSVKGDSDISILRSLQESYFRNLSNITIEQWKDHYTFKNPGALLVGKAQYSPILLL
ncbi:MAG: hypothetical protein RR249_05000, partial [Tannerellaceae bacterium]